jgi:Fe-Mn family superoxide dismutase
LAPTGSAKLDGDLKSAIVNTWGSEEAFMAEFNKIALGTFGSGWTWLVKKPDGSIGITSTSNAATPLTTEDVAILACDVWEHAYYIDTRNSRPKYLENFWKVLNWEKAGKRYTSR